MRRFYWKDLTTKMYENLCDENVIVECGIEMSNVKRDKPKVPQLVMMTNLHILQTVLEYNYDRNKKNKKYDKQKILAMTKTIDMLWDGKKEWQN